MAIDKEALLAEERKIRRLRRAMDVAVALLWQVDLTLAEAQEVVEHAKKPRCSYSQIKRKLSI